MIAAHWFQGCCVGNKDIISQVCPCFPVLADGPLMTIPLFLRCIDKLLAEAIGDYIEASRPVVNIYYVVGEDCISPSGMS